MQIEWPETKNGKPTGETLSGAVPGEIEEIIGVIGIELAVELLLKFGGAFMIPPVTRVTEESSLAGVVGKEAALKLGRTLGRRRVPVENKFLPRYLRSKGYSLNDIFRTLRITDITVDKYFKSDVINAADRV